MDAAAVRALALGLPEAEEYQHGGLPAFRVRGTRFATIEPALLRELVTDAWRNRAPAALRRTLD
ncbi:hypothetical protein [Leifsonia aquatica]|uniref:hypothetical protein n=1 Tax=Leifsonia aquatica TaxID=144185 RepID=UPI0028A9A331|nr:hypothetical protein [Leifsonia aquatica]